MYTPTWVDWGLLFGSIATVRHLFLLFLRFLPAVAVFEVKELRRELEHHGPGVHFQSPADAPGAHIEDPEEAT